MKKQIIAIMALALTFQMAKAQTEKGKQTLGLNLGFQSTTSTFDALNATTGAVVSSQQYKNTTFSIGPSYSYFIANKLDLGVDLNYSHVNQNTPSGTAIINQNTNSFGGILYLRKYVLFDDKIGFRAGGRVGYSHGDTQNTYTSTTVFNSNSKINDYAVGGLVDLVYYPSKNLGVTAAIANLTYQHVTTDVGTTSKSTSDAFAFNFINNNLGFSVFYTFGGK